MWKTDGVNRTGYHAVCIAFFNHHGAVVSGITHGVTSVLHADTFLFTCLEIGCYVVFGIQGQVPAEY